MTSYERPFLVALFQVDSYFNTGSPASPPCGGHCQYLYVSALVADTSTPQLQPEWPATATATDPFTFIHMRTLVTNVPMVSDHYRKPKGIHAVP